MTIRICVSIPPRTVGEALGFIEKAENQRADFIEVRLDRLEKNTGLSDIAHCSDTPLVATNRSTDSQGDFSGSEIERLETLLDAAKNGFEYVDVELSTPKLSDIVGTLQAVGVNTVISFHDNDRTPNLCQLKGILRREIESGADICKIVTKARRAEDNLIVLDLASKASKRARIVCFSMGILGTPSRLLSPLFGAFFTIASLEKGRETASGQITAAEMRTAYKTLGLK